MITEDGCWADYRIADEPSAGRRCLFLDRDGVVIEDTGYPHDPSSIVLIPETLDLVRHARDRGLVVGLVTNQSGIGRGYFGWDAFQAVQSAIDAALARRGASFDFVLACPHHAEAASPLYRQSDHPWRKPAPGMLLAALDALRLDPSRSAMIGDQRSDMAAAKAAHVGHRGLLVERLDDAPEGSWTLVQRQTLPDWLDHIISGEDADNSAIAQTRA